MVRHARLSVCKIWIWVRRKILVRLYLLIDLVQHLDRRSIGLNLNARSGFINRLGLGKT